MDKRHFRRIQTVQNLFAWSYSQDTNTLPDKEDEKTLAVIKSLPQIDELITKHAEKFTIDKIARTDLAILRLSIYELMIEKQIPPKVIIDEAVEIAKEMAGDKSYAFINAVLGKILSDAEKN